jgi:hypothetical protein
MRLHDISTGTLPFYHFLFNEDDSNNYDDDDDDNNNNNNTRNNQGNWLKQYQS